MIEPVPEGDHPSIHAPAPSNPNPELAFLEGLLDPPGQSAFPTQFHAPPNTSLRFPSDRPLPQGFRLSRGNDRGSTTPITRSPQPNSPSNPFSATPLQVPVNFSPSKVQDAKASSSAPVAKDKKPSKKPSAKGPTGGTRTRTSTRNKPEKSYADEVDSLDDE